MALAKSVEGLITSGTFIYLLHFMMNLLVGLKTFSTIAQRSLGILIEQETFRKELVSLTEVYKTANGVNLTKILSENACNENGDCTISPTHFY